MKMDSMSDLWKMENEMEREQWILIKEMFMMEIGRMTLCMVQACTIGRMVINIMGNGKMIL